MQDKLWHEMSVAEKLDWLHDAFRAFLDTANANSHKLEARHREVLARLSAVEAEVKSVAAASEDRS